MRRRRAPAVDGQGDTPSGCILCLICCCSGEIRRLSPENGNVLMGSKPMMITETSIGRKQAYSAVQISEREIVVATSHSTPFVFDVMSGTQRATLEGGGTAYTGAVSFVPQSQILVSGGGDKSVVLWNRREDDDDSSSSDGGSSFVLKCQMEGHTRTINCLDARCDGSNLVVSGSWDKTARVWDVSREECVAVLDGHSAGLWSLCHDTENQIQFTGSWDMTVCCWDFRTNQKIVATLRPSPNWVEALCYRRAKSQLVVPSYGGSVRVIDIRMLQQRSSSQKTLVVNEWKSGHTHSVYGCCDVVDKDFFVTSGNDDAHIKAWRDDGKCVWDGSDSSAECPRRILPFTLEGNPELIRQREEEEAFLFLISFCQFSVVVVSVVQWKEVLAWKCLFAL